MLKNILKTWKKTKLQRKSCFTFFNCGVKSPPLHQIRQDKSRSVGIAWSESWGERDVWPAVVSRPGGEEGAERIL